MRTSLAMTDLDPRLTFDTFVVGPANRLATAAARRAADSPGASYNPLFIYSPSGLGKSHILMAIAHHSDRVNPDDRVLYQTMEGYLDELAQALEGGQRDDLKERYGELDFLLLDDVQFLSGQPEAQELLLRTLDALSVSGSQIVLASDRPPSEIDGLDDRLLSRFSGGLIVDIAPPEYETRVAIVRRKVEERGASLEEGVAEAIARHPFQNVRELAGALNRVLAVQDLEERRVTADEVGSLVGVEKSKSGEADGDDFDDFLSEVSTDLETTVAAQEEPWRVELRELAEEMEAAGFRADRIHRLVARDDEPDDLEGIVRGVRERVERLREIERELEEAGNPWPDAASSVLKDPERLDEAEALLASARERARPFPEVPEGPGLDELEGRLPPLAVKAARQLVTADRPEYNPLFVWDPAGEAARRLLEATARTFVEERDGGGRVAMISVAEFAEEFIEALSSGVAGAWRERWWDVELLLVHGAEALSQTERAQDEFFHLFEALKRREARVMLAADRAPGGIESIDDRLRTRFEGGLVLELDEADETATARSLGEDGGDVVPPLSDLELTDDGRGGLFVESDEEEDAPAHGATPEEDAPPPDARPEEDAQAPDATPEEARAGDGAAPGEWNPSSETVVWEWPDLSDRIAEEEHD